MLLTQSDEAGEHGSVNGPNPSEVSTKGNYIYHLVQKLPLNHI